MVFTSDVSQNVPEACTRNIKKHDYTTVFYKGMLY